MRKFKEEDDIKTSHSSYGSKYSTLYYSIILGNEDGYPNKSEAENVLKEFREILKNRDITYSY